MTDLASIDDIRADFALLDDWEDRYRYLIEIGRSLPGLPEAFKTEATKVRGCASQVWLVTRKEPSADGGVRLVFEGDSDAHIVRGLIALLLSAYSGRSPAEALAIDIHALLAGLGLNEHLTPQRSNGLKAMIERIRAEARAAMPAA